MKNTILGIALLSTFQVNAELVTGVLKCDLGVFKIVGGEYIFDYGSKEGANVVEKGNKFSISGSIFNDDSPVLSVKQEGDRRFDSAKTADIKFTRIIQKDNVSYSAESKIYKLAIQADKCRTMK